MLFPYIVIYVLTSPEDLTNVNIHLFTFCEVPPWHHSCADQHAWVYWTLPPPCLELRRSGSSASAKAGTACSYAVYPRLAPLPRQAE